LGILDIYEMIYNISYIRNSREKICYIKRITDSILGKTNHRSNFFDRSVVEFTNREYETLFKYSNVRDYLSFFGSFLQMESIFGDLKVHNLDENYLFHMSIPFKELKNFFALGFISYYGIVNISEFDRENNHFFSANNGQRLIEMYTMFMINNRFPSEWEEGNSRYDEFGNFVPIESPQTKEEFYEAFKRMAIYGPSNRIKYKITDFDFFQIQGVFREKNRNLFIADDAPEELKTKFYNRDITPIDIRDNREWYDYLKGKDLFYLSEIQIAEKDNIANVNFYNFLRTKMSIYEVLDFIVEYAIIIQKVFYETDPEFYENAFIDAKNKVDIVNALEKLFYNFLTRFRIHYLKADYIPKSIREKYPELFLPDNAPEELKKEFYSNGLSAKFILSDKKYKNYLSNINLKVIWGYIYISYRWLKKHSLIDSLKQIFSHSEILDIMLKYGVYLEKLFAIAGLGNLKIDSEYSKETAIDSIEHVIIQGIKKGVIYYDDKVPDSIKNEIPTLFLSDNIDDSIKSAFYNREFTLEYIENNPDILSTIGNTNIIYGFNPEYVWIGWLYKFDEAKIANEKEIEILKIYSVLKNPAFLRKLKRLIIANCQDLERIKKLGETLAGLEVSNSNEIYRFRFDIVDFLDDETIEQEVNNANVLFSEDIIPDIQKLYWCFELKYPKLRAIPYFYSPNLLSVYSINGGRNDRCSLIRTQNMIFSDLLRINLRSNNRSLRKYIKNLERGSQIFKEIIINNLEIGSLSREDIKVLEKYAIQLNTLYNSTLYGKKHMLRLSKNLKLDLLNLASVFLKSENGLDISMLNDRIVRMFCHFAGFDTLDELKNYMAKSIDYAEKRNIRRALEQDFRIEKGDFIKGLANQDKIDEFYRFIPNILGNGSLCKEFLGIDMRSDTTPLDTDVSRVDDEPLSFRECFYGHYYAAARYSPLWLVLKCDDRFNFTESVADSYDREKLEVFELNQDGHGHYGIRTGFASSDIDYFVVSDILDDKVRTDRIKFEIVMNGFYIPIVNTSGDLVFGYDEYLKLKEQMSALSYYGTEDEYSFASELDDFIIEDSNLQEKIDLQIDRGKYITEAIKTRLKDTNSAVFEGIELIHIGSINRGTSVKENEDYDYIMVIDREVYEKPEELYDMIDKAFPEMNLNKESYCYFKGIRNKTIKLNGEQIQIDISFISRSEMPDFSTDDAVCDKLLNIKRINPENYLKVVANIILAKKTLKDVYNSRRARVNPQGGLSGVGIENWILQSGGSFERAAKTFLEATKDYDYNGFKYTAFTSFGIWDFGKNYFAYKLDDKYPHSEFIRDYMNESGFNKMRYILQEYINNIEKRKEHKIMQIN